jgi:hypothetical protein
MSRRFQSSLNGTNNRLGTAIPCPRLPEVRENQFSLQGLLLSMTFFSMGTALLCRAESQVVAAWSNLLLFVAMSVLAWSAFGIATGIFFGQQRRFAAVGAVVGLVYPIARAIWFVIYSARH